MLSETITDVFFDLDHTLWDFDRNSALAFERVFIKHKIEVELPQFIRQYEPINLIYWKKFRDEIVSKEEMRRGRLVDTFHLLNMNFPLSSIDILVKSYIEELPLNNHLFPGTEEILNYLHQRYKLHIITNGFEEMQNLKLQNSGIDTYFTTITTSEEVGAKKPNPIIFNKAMLKAGVLPECSIMIGDSFEADICGAHKVGMNTLFFNYKKEIIDSSVLSINELLQIKDRL